MVFDLQAPFDPAGDRSDAGGRRDRILTALRVFDAYEEAWPLPAGWRERVPLYTLYHLMNHLNLFGGGYGAQALSVVRRFV